MKDYIVIEIQRNSDGTMAVLSDTYEDVASARSSFYTKCGIAVLSNVLIHSLVLMNNAGNVIEQKSFRHDPPATVPDPVTEPEEEQ